MRVVVTGGAGYIGSHAVLALLERGHAPAVVDDLSAGDAALLPAVVAAVDRLHRSLDWRPRHDDLDAILASALAWERRRAPPPREAAGRLAASV